MNIMPICPECGNKRCAKAMDPSAACRASNQPLEQTTQRNSQTFEQWKAWSGQ